VSKSGLTKKRKFPAKRPSVLAAITTDEVRAVVAGAAVVLSVATPMVEPSGAHN